MPLFRIQRRLVRFVMPMLAAAALLLVLATLTSWAANTIVWQPASAGLPASGVIRDVAFGDVNNDGQPDLIAVGTNGVVVYQGNGAGVWNGVGFSNGLPVAGQYGHVVVGDFNNDGKLDIAASQNSGGGVRAWTGNGAGTWTAWTGLPAGNSYEGLAFADVNHDGWDDLIVAGSSGAAGIHVFQNAFASFSQTTSITTTGTYYDLAVGYVDGDNWLDVAAAAQAGTGGVRFWRGNFGTWAAANSGLTATNTFRGVEIGDVDLDGKPELLASRFGFPSATGGGMTIYKYDSSANTWSLAPNQIPLTNSYYKLLLDDLNNDGWLDLTAGGGSTGGSAGLFTYLGSATGFISVTPPITGGSFDRPATGDFDQNGLIDVAAAGTGNSGVGAWSDQGVRDPIGAWTPLASPQITGVMNALGYGDFNRDGDLDVVMSRDFGAGLVAYVGDGGNSWATCPITMATGATAGNWLDVAVGPWGNTGSIDPDVIAASGSGNGIWYYGHSGGCTYWYGFSFSSINTGSYRGLSVADMDNDFAYDIVAAPADAATGIRVWSGPNHTQMPNPTSTGSYYDTALGDFNNDGKLDIVAAGDTTGIQAFQQVSIRAFVSRTITSTGTYQAIAVGDLNNDGQLDVVAGANGASSGVDVWLGDGTFTTWTRWPSPDTTNQFFDVAVGDVNHDGWLDILAGGENIGPQVWLGDGAGSWTLSTTALPTTGSYFRSQFGHIDHDGNLDILATIPGSGLQMWAAAEAAPPTINNIQPSGWVSTTQSPTVNAKVIDTGSGISTTSGLYRFSTDGGSTWNAFAPAAISGSSGSTSTQSLTASSVLFNQDSATQNKIEFRASDLVGNVGVAQAVIKIDIMPPSAPSFLLSPDHTVNVWSNINTIGIEWGGATDATSGVYAYSALFDQNPTTLPPPVVNAFAGLFTSSPLSDGGNWYAHVRTVDHAGNWSSTAIHLGPFKIDTVPPTNPTTVNSTDHALSTWSNDPTISMSWSGASDSGSGVSGYSYAFDTAGGTLPDNVQDTNGTSAVSAALTSGNKYFHIRTRDNAGNWSAAVHRGPYRIDVTPPTVSMSSPFNSNSNTFLVTWSGSDAHSGIANYDVQYRNVTLGGNWINWKTNTTQTSDSFFGLGGHIYYFRARARDNVGNISPYNVLYDTRTGVATIDLQVKNPGLEVNQAVQDLNNSVTLIANKRTFVRCYVQTSYGTVLLVPARLRVYRGATLLGALSPANPGALINVKASPYRDELNDAFYFDVPTGWLNPGSVRFDCEVNTPVKYAETTTANNIRSVTVNFVRAPDMNLLMVNARYRYLNVVRNVRDLDRIRLEKWLKAAYPIHKLNVWWGYIDPPYNSLPNVDTLNNDLAWNKSKKILGANEDPWTRYYGMVIQVDNNTFMRGKAKGIPGTVASGPTASTGGWDPDGVYGDWYGGHEIGHSYNRKHAEFCGAEGGAGYPYPGGRISPALSEWANNTLYGIDRSLDTPLIITPDWTDVMTYCDNEWMSDFTYEGIYARMVAEKPVAAAQLQALKAQGVEHLAVFGTIVTQTNVVTLSTFYRVPNAFDMFGRDVNGEYHIQLLNAGNSVLADYNFSPRSSVEADDPVAAITEYVPWVTDTQKIVIASATQALVTRTVSANPPTVTLQAPGGGITLTGSSVIVSWTAFDADDDPLTFSLDYSMDGGVTWSPLSAQILSTTISIDLPQLPGSPGGKFRVWVSDGVNTAYDETDGTFSVANKFPQITSLSPISGTTYVAGQTIAFEATTFDPEDGALPDDHLQWSSSIDGALGAGGLLQLDTLSEGVHTVTVTATDSNGAQSTANLIVVVGAEPSGGGVMFDVFLPLITKN